MPGITAFRLVPDQGFTAEKVEEGSAPATPAIFIASHIITAGAQPQPGVRAVCSREAELMALYDDVRQIAQVLIRRLPEVTPDSIRAQVNAAVATVPEADGQVDVDALAEDLRARFAVQIGRGTVLENNVDHIAWLPTGRARITWSFWDRYREYLEHVKGWAPQTVDRLGESVDDVLSRLEDPARDGGWDRRGLVVGQVQSGKTGNYTGLICKAVDAGYKLIIVLSGLHNSLRSQTQLRLDEGFLGFDTSRSLDLDERNNYRIGVGLLPAAGVLIAHALTSSSDAGDFRRAVANQIGVRLGGDPVLLVVKKNGSVLRNLLNWALAVAGDRNPATGDTVVREVPVLVIDDEADTASPNTARPEPGLPADEQDPTVINGLIRQLLSSFEQSAYIGYTATPFANVFIDPEGHTPEHGEDLFPRSFIVNLPTPTNYVGPVEVFGLDADPDIGLERIAGLDIIRPVRDHGTWIPDRHRSDWVPPSILPASLSEAVRAFILSCAGRSARGQQYEHKSMLVHVTRFTAVQAHVTGQVRAEVGAISRLLLAVQSPSGGDHEARALLAELEALWERDFAPTSEDMGDRAGRPLLEWEDVRPLLGAEAAKIQVREINGTAGDVLDYETHRAEGLSVIAVGGDKLARGLTLEGLSVSYYLRAARMYDTLMQMGRWFGYRPNYVDLCRLYTTDELVEWYRHITLASEELRREFDAMAVARMTPEEFGLRVRSHPNGLLITAANKLRNGTVVPLSYSGDISETVAFDLDEGVLAENVRHLEIFIDTMGGGATAAPRTDDGDTVIWRQVPGERVAEFLDGLRTHPASPKARGQLLARYIRRQLGQAELTNWTVVLLSKADADPRDFATLAGLRVGLTTRSRSTRVASTADRYSIGRLVSPRHEMIDLTPEELARARQLAVERRRLREVGRDGAAVDGVGAPVGGGDSDASRGEGPGDRPDAPDAGAGTQHLPGGVDVRRARPKERGLLLIYPLVNAQTSDGPRGTPMVGIAVSFPASDTARSIDYVVNNIYWEQEFEE